MQNSNNKWGFGIIVLTILVSLFIVIFTFTKNNNREPRTVYTVYLDGKTIGNLASKKSFDEYINVKEEELKNKYKVDKVYTPDGVEIKKNFTYDNIISSDEQIYNRIISNKKFTIKGYEIDIDNPNDENYEKKTIYVLSKDIFDEAVTNTIKAFVDEEQYNKFINGTQEEIKELGSMIENIDLEENITYKEVLIPTNKTIFTDAETLGKYLLYGTLDKQETYVVNANDTIESIANDHKLNVKEFLIANPQFTSENNLLYESQVVYVGLIKPVITVLVDIHSVSDEERAFDTETEYDSTQYIGYNAVAREGENGLDRVTRKSQYKNGQLISGIVESTTNLKPAVNRIVVKGDKYAPNVADVSYWAWPTDRPYTITSYFEWRWGSFHTGVDIYVGYGAPIYAANNGVVHSIGTGCTPGYTSCNGGQGNYVLINHNVNGYYTIYMHMKDIYVNAGQTVVRGQKIGTMGNTGNCVPVPSPSNPYGGTHLHFGLRIGAAYGNHLNPLNLY